MANSKNLNFSPNGENFAYSSPDGSLKIWDTNTGILKQEYTHSTHLSATCSCLAWAPTHKVKYCNTHTPHVWVILKHYRYKVHIQNKPRLIDKSINSNISSISCSILFSDLEQSPGISLEWFRWSCSCRSLDLQPRLLYLAQYLSLIFV